MYDWKQTEFYESLELLFGNIFIVLRQFEFFRLLPKSVWQFGRLKVDWIEETLLCCRADNFRKRNWAKNDVSSRELKKFERVTHELLNFDL